jgi:hypothetical protein
VQQVARRAQRRPDGGDDLTTYRFNTGVRGAHLPPPRRIHWFYVPRSHPDQIDVNVRCLDGVDVAALAPFDGQNWEDAARIARC